MTVAQDKELAETTGETTDAPQANSLYQKHKLKFTVLFIVMALVAVSFILSTGFQVHHNDIPDEYWSEIPVIKDKLLDKEGFMGALAAISILTFCLVIYGYWKLHSLPKKHSEHTGQSRLVFWLCMLGFFYNWLWIAAILIVVTDWSKIANVFRSKAS